jgi:MFS family permease
VLRPVNLSPLKLQPFICTCMLVVLAVSGGLQVPVMALVMAALGTAGAMGNVALDTYILVRVPDKKLARVTSIEMLLDFAACALGPALGGLLTEVAGTGDALWWLVGLTAAIAIAAVLGPHLDVLVSPAVAGEQQASVSPVPAAAQPDSVMAS